MIRTKKGLKIPIDGEPTTLIEKAKPARTVAVTGPDFVGMKPTMYVKEGENVETGQRLFECKKNPGLIFTSPVSGKILSIKRGLKRAFQTIESMRQLSNYSRFFKGKI